MATKKAPAKVISKKAPAKKAVAVKKEAPKAKPAVKKAAVVAPKKAVKPVAKKAAAPAKVVKPVAKKVATASKPVAKKQAPAAKVVASKPAAKKTAKPATPVAVKAAEKPAKVAPVAKEKKPKKEKKVVVPKKRMVTSIPVSKATIAAREKQRAANQPKENIAAIRVVKATNRVAPTGIPAKPVAPVKRVKPPTNAKDIKITPAKPVSIPKINTKTTRQYRPDFTHSVLDTPKSSLSESITRYSDADLLEFKELIQRKLQSAKAELAYLQGLITRKDGLGGDGSDNKHMTMEDGSLSMEREQLSQMASRQITFTDHLEKALMRIENKTYGICRVTGKLIEKARLMAVPHATLSMEAKSTQNNR